VVDDGVVLAVADDEAGLDGFAFAGEHGGLDVVGEGAAFGFLAGEAAVEAGEADADLLLHLGEAVVEAHRLVEVVVDDVDQVRLGEGLLGEGGDPLGGVAVACRPSVRCRPRGFLRRLEVGFECALEERDDDALEAVLGGGEALRDFGSDLGVGAAAEVEAGAVDDPLELVGGEAGGALGVEPGRLAGRLLDVGDVGVDAAEELPGGAGVGVAATRVGKAAAAGEEVGGDAVLRGQRLLLLLGDAAGERPLVDVAGGAVGELVDGLDAVALHVRGEHRGAGAGQLEAGGSRVERRAGGEQLAVDAAEAALDERGGVVEGLIEDLAALAADLEAVDVRSLPVKRWSFGSAKKWREALRTASWAASTASALRAIACLTTGVRWASPTTAALAGDARGRPRS
jgi:hypothetical protein